MKTWTRLPTDERCGACGATILRETPICLLAFPQVKRHLLRCQACVGPAPDTLAARQREADLIELESPPHERLPYREDP